MTCKFGDTVDCNWWNPEQNINWWRNSVGRTAFVGGWGVVVGNGTVSILDWDHAFGLRVARKDSYRLPPLLVLMQGLDSKHWQFLFPSTDTAQSTGSLQQFVDCWVCVFVVTAWVDTVRSASAMGWHCLYPQGNRLLCAVTVHQSSPITIKGEDPPFYDVK